MTDRTRTTLAGTALLLGFVLPFVAGIVAERQLRGIQWTSDSSLRAEIDRGDPLFASWAIEPPDRLFRYARDSKDRIHADLRSKPRNLELLVSQPEAIEPQLQSGRWLVLVYSILSSPDVHAFLSTREIAGQLEGTARVAARPTLAFEDTQKWLPGYEAESYPVHPLWVILEDGIKVRRFEGSMDADEAVRFTRQATRDTGTQHLP